MVKPVLNDFEDEIEVDDELEEQFGDKIQSVISKTYQNSSKNHKEPKFRKDGFYEKNRK
jgi:citrate lyase gamma subunit